MCIGTHGYGPKSDVNRTEKFKSRISYLLVISISWENAVVFLTQTLLSQKKIHKDKTTEHLVYSPLLSVSQHQLSELYYQRLLHCTYGLCERSAFVKKSFPRLVERPRKKHKQNNDKNSPENNKWRWRE